MQPVVETKDHSSWRLAVAVKVLNYGATGTTITQKDSAVVHMQFSGGVDWFSNHESMDYWFTSKSPHTMLSTCLTLLFPCLRDNSLL